MNHNIALETILRLAARETVSAKYPAITPTHLLIALSRFSETDEYATAESKVLRDEFEQLGIEPRRFRRRLRALLGNQGSNYQDGMIHRSPVCKAVFAHAASLANAENAHLAAVHLLHAALVTTWDLRTETAEENALANPASPADDIPDEL